jgi:hypothetical protein
MTPIANTLRVRGLGVKWMHRRSTLQRGRGGQEEEGGVEDGWMEWLGGKHRGNKSCVRNQQAASDTASHTQAAPNTLRHGQPYCGSGG